MVIGGISQNLWSGAHSSHHLRGSLLDPEFGAIACCGQDSNQHIGRDTLRIAIRNGGDLGS